MLKQKVYRSTGYRLYVANLPCCVSDSTAQLNDPHHIKGRGYGGSVKCSDMFIIPLCHELHSEFHQIGWESFEKKYNMNQIEHVMATLEQAYFDGILRFRTKF